MSHAPAASPIEPAGPRPGVGRRLAALLYEGVLLFGIVFFAALAFALVFQQRNGLVHHRLLAAWIALVVGAYFVWFWTHGGQTLPMKTWRLRLVAADGARSRHHARSCATCSAGCGSCRRSPCIRCCSCRCRPPWP